MLILAINPGSTSTKIGVFEGKKQLFEKVLRHSAEELSFFKNVTDQYEFRKKEIILALKENNIQLKSLDAIACRGGATNKRVEGGTYLVCDKMCEEHKNSPIQHPASLAAIIGKDLADELDIEAYVTDSPLTYELSELAKISGHKDIKRSPMFHALNSKAIARQYAKENGKKYEDVKVIVCHMGGGITVSCHKDGKAIDATDAVSGGPITPERTGTLPMRTIIDMCFSGEYSHDQMKKMIQGKGGVFSYLKTVDMRDVEAMYREGNKKAKLVLDAMVYQISKEISSMAAVLYGQVDAILLTGGIAYSDYIVSEITKRCKFIGDIKAYPGEKELEALVLGVIRVKNNEEQVKLYSKDSYRKTKLA